MEHQIINDLVMDMLNKHIGGQKFFDNLDYNFRDIKFISLVLNRIEEKYSNHLIITSGQFGKLFNKYKDDVVVVTGGIRTGAKVDNLSFLADCKKDILFVDDSIYSGGTRLAIEKELNKYGLHIKDTLVLYDGSKLDNIDSFYKYGK